MLTVDQMLRHRPLAAPSLDEKVQTSVLKSAELVSPGILMVSVMGGKVERETRSKNYLLAYHETAVLSRMYNTPYSQRNLDAAGSWTQ